MSKYALSSAKIFSINSVKYSFRTFELKDMELFEFLNDTSGDVELEFDIKPEFIEAVFDHILKQKYASPNFVSVSDMISVSKFAKYLCIAKNKIIDILQNLCTEKLLEEFIRECVALPYDPEMIFVCNCVYPLDRRTPSKTIWEGFSMHWDAGKQLCNVESIDIMRSLLDVTKEFPTFQRCFLNKLVGVWYNNKIKERIDSNKQSKELIDFYVAFGISVKSYSFTIGENSVDEIFIDGELIPIVENISAARYQGKTSGLDISPGVLRNTICSNIINRAFGL